MNPEKNVSYIIIIFLQLSSTTDFNIITRNVSWAANQYIRVISEALCDTEDWSNDAENSALQSQEWIKNEKYIQIEHFYFKLYYLTVFLYIWLNKYSLGEHKFFQKHKKYVV